MDDFTYVVKKLFPFMLVALIIVILLAAASKSENRCTHDQNTVEF